MEKKYASEIFDQHLSVQKFLICKTVVNALFLCIVYKKYFSQEVKKIKKIKNGKKMPIIFFSQSQNDMMGFKDARRHAPLGLLTDKNKQGRAENISKQIQFFRTPP